MQRYGWEEFSSYWQLFSTSWQGSFQTPAPLSGIMILSVLLVIHGLQMTKDADGNADLGGAVLKGPMASLVMIVAYAVCMSFTGYFVSTAIFLPLGMAALGQRNWQAILGVTVGLELFVWFLFVVQLQLRMP